MSLRLATLLAVCAALLPGFDDQSGDRTTVTVAQDGSGDFNGTDDEPIREALLVLKGRGGTLQIEDGEYLIRRTILVPPGVTLHGSTNTVLRLPSPVRTTRAVKAGETILRVENARELAAEVVVDILPPDGQRVFSDGETEVLGLQRLLRAERGEIQLAEALPFDLPAKSRIGCPNKILRLGPQGNVAIENICFDGGLVPEIPMPGNHLRTAIWAAAPFVFEEGARGSPAANITIRHCTFRNCYGPGVAFYNVVNGRVEGCRFENITDDAIDFNQYSQRCRAAGNEIRNATWGVTLSDTAYCVVEFNRIYDCVKGIYIRWNEDAPNDGVNVFNTIQSNFVTGSQETAIHLSRNCHKNLVSQNYVERPILVEEDSNQVEDNTRL